jgi:DNA mismatch repair ATPase MutS
VLAITEFLAIILKFQKVMHFLVKEEFGYERKQTLANSERFITPILKRKRR